MIRKSELAGQVDRFTRKMLKSMLRNFERTGYDTEKTVQLEVVKVELSRLAGEHYHRTLMCKAMFSLMKTMIDCRDKDPAVYYKSTNSEANTTLHRLLEGVISSSKESQLNEFIQIEQTLETELSETLTSEPALLSSQKPEELSAREMIKAQVPD